MARKLTDAEIDARMMELFNLRKLHVAARVRVTVLEEENKTLKARITFLEEENRGLKAEIGELREMVERLTDTGTKYRFFLFKEKHVLHTRTKKKPAPRPVESYRRPLPKQEDITEHTTLTLSSCPKCGGTVSPIQETYTRYIEDIVLAPKRVIEYTIHRHYCTSCKALVHAAIPGALPGMRVGLTTLFYVLVEHYRNKKTDAAIVESLATLHHLHLSEGEVSEIRHTASLLLGAKHDEIVEAIRHAAVVYVDETGWHILGKKSYCWHFNAPALSIARYVMADTRGRGVAVEALGTSFNGTLVTDFYRAYDHIAKHHQTCWAHLLRETHLLSEANPDNKERARLHRALTELYARIKRFKMKKWDEVRAKRTERIFSRVLTDLMHQRWRDRESKRIIARIVRYQTELLTCIRLPNVLPENNTAERGLRSVVVHRKITNGNRSDKGAQTYSINKSVIETLYLEGGNIMKKLSDLLYQGAWKKLGYAM